MPSKINQKTKTLIIGSFIGAIIGIAASYILLKRMDTDETSPALTRSQGLKIGMGVIGLLKMVSDLSVDKT